MHAERHDFADAALVYVAFVGIGVAQSLALLRLPSRALAVGVAAALSIALIAVALGARRADRPRFPLGSVQVAFIRVWWLWLAGAAVALGAAWHGGFPQDAARLIGWLLVGVVLAPLGEELTMRGVLQTALDRTRFGARKVFGCTVGTLLAATLFGCAHFVWLVAGASLAATLVEVVSAVALGVVAGVVYQRSGNIWYGVLLHAIGNLGGA